MALATSFAVQYTPKSKSLSDEEKDKRFIFTEESGKKNTVDLYVNYTNNMVFNDNYEKYKLLANFIFPSYRYNKYTNDYNPLQDKELLHIKFTVNGTHESVYPIPQLGNTAVDKSPSKYYKDFLYAYKKEEGRHFTDGGDVTIADILKNL